MSIPARGCRAALRHSSRRAFSTSPASQRHALPHFEPSSTPELNAVLAHARARILVPAHLNAAQRALVYREQHRARLTDAKEPVYSTVAGEDVALEHIDVQRDVPARWRVLRDAMALATTPADWENVGALIEGMRDAKAGVREAWVEKFVRGACAAGAGGVVLRCLQRVERTGVRLRGEGSGVVGRVLWGFRGIAASPVGEEAEVWGEEETEKALRFVEQVLELMERPEHCGKRRVVEGDPRTLPFVIATPLELAAVRALRWGEGADADGKVKRYAERLVVNLRHYGIQEDALPSGFEDLTTRRYESLNAASLKMQRLIPVWRGLTLSQRVLKEQMPMPDVETYRFATQLREDIEAAANTVRANLKEDQDPAKHWAIKAWEDVKDE